MENCEANGEQWSGQPAIISFSIQECDCAESVGLLVLESVVDSLVFGMGFNSLTVATVDSLKEKDTFPRKTNECPLKNGGWKTSLSV